MELTNELHPSALFKHVNIRGARKPAREGKQIEFIVSADVVPIPTSGTLYSNAISAKNSPNAYTTIVAQCRSFQEMGSYLPTVESVYVMLPNLRTLIESLRTETKVKENWIAEVESILGENISSYFSNISLSNKKEILWNNLVCQVFIEGNGQMVGHLLQVMACIYLLENIANIHNDKDLKRLLNARVLLPEWVGELIKSQKQKNSDNGAGDKIISPKNGNSIHFPHGFD